MQADSRRRSPVGRGASTNPPNPYETSRLESDVEHVQWWAEHEAEALRVRTQAFPDDSRSLIASNNSPDIPFRYSINPYRGCEHGCAYCYARPTHERLGMSGGLDFEATILVKYGAAALLRRALRAASWRGETIALSGVTDCYQPLERAVRVTRGILEVMCESNSDR